MAGPGAKETPQPAGPEPQVRISRADKSLTIAVPDGWAGELTLTRKELYRYGKMMGKRGRAGK
jgi:hypothetical protein